RLRQIAREMALHAREAGDHLIEVERRLGPEDFEAWCRRSLPFDEVWVLRYMQIALHWDAIEERRTTRQKFLSVLGFFDKLRQVAGARPGTRKEVESMSNEVDRTLTSLTAKIEAAHQRCMATRESAAKQAETTKNSAYKSLLHAKRAGELLIEARALVEHGQ
ncbi:hypothetical protein JYT84_00575, partial [bacterium AH-315-M10]|nr:hypothetical protein [bacterium AH-315-M10]